MAVVWNITRAADEAESLVRELEAQGLEARALPCIERTRLGWPKVPASALLFLTSAAALPIPDEARENRVVALGKAAEALRKEGRQIFAESEGGVVSLASAFADAWARHGAGERAQVMYLCSTLASEQAEHAEALVRMARFADVTTHVVYRVAPPPNLSQALRTVCAGSGLVFFSPSAVTHFLAAQRDAQMPAPAAVVTHGASTARAWNDARPAGWPEAVGHVRDLPLIETLRRFS
jgi:uroporphyrinogen-III synthase